MTHRPIPSPALAPRLVAAALAALSAAGAAQAQDEPAYTPDPAVLQQVETMARSGANAVTATAADPKGVRVEVKVGKLDPRLKLAPCLHIQPYLPPGLPAWGATRMGLRCTQGARLWNVSLPITVSVFMQATVVKDALPAGTVLDAGQLAQAEVDIAAAPGPAFPDLAPLVGRTLSRNLAAGAAVHQPDLKPRQYFAAGDTVRVVALGGGWQITTDAQAVTPGVEGQVARVRTDSGRLINARPNGDHQVELTL